MMTAKQIKALEKWDKDMDNPETKPPVVVQRVVMPHLETVQYAAYILNHYSRNSHADKLCLARDLERHGWSKRKSSNDRTERHPPSASVADTKNL